MPDPQLNESAIVRMLDAIATPKNTERLTSGAFLSVVDSADRKIEREEYVALVQDAMGMVDMLTRLELTSAIQNRFKENILTEATFTDAIKELTKRAEGLRESLKHRMEMVSQCPYETDTKH